MNRPKLIFYSFLISLFLISCDPDEIIDKLTDAVCDVSINQINDDYDDLVLEVQNNANLSEEEKTTRINELNNERAKEVAEIEEDCG